MDSFSKFRIVSCEQMKIWIEENQLEIVRNRQREINHDKVHGIHKQSTTCKP